MLMVFISPESKRMRIPDIRMLVCRAAEQIPRGMVSTYGDIAKALGDIRASRVVGMIMSANERPIVMPCHRVVYSDGKVGWYGGMGRGTDRKVEILASEGVETVQGRVKDFNHLRFDGFQIEPVLSKMMEEQRRLRDLVVYDDDPSEVERVVGLDVSYEGETGFAAAACFDYESGELVDERVATSEITFPYIPGYLSYRELPALRELVDWGEGTVYMVDGQGSLHPRRFGIACHLGVFFDVPTIGVAKSLLCGSVGNLEGDSSPVHMDGELAGLFLKGNGGKGIYVSVGHRTSLDRCRSVCRRFMRYRIPEPLRRAHTLANKTREDWRNE